MEAPPTRPLVSPPALVVVTLLTALLGSLLINRVQEIGDEYATIPQIKTFLAGDWSVQKNLAVPPVYHALVAGIARVFGVNSVPGWRLISLLLCLPIMPLFYLCAQALTTRERTTAPLRLRPAVEAAPDRALLQTLQFLFLPILLPFLFILTTDAFALMLFVLALCLALYDRPWLSGLAALLDVAVRQNQIVWVAWLFTWLFLREKDWSLRPSRVGRHLLKYWTFCLVFVVFVVFVIVNRGLTLGQHEEIHQPGLYLGNVWFALLLCSFLLLPTFLAPLPQYLAVIRIVSKQVSGVLWLSIVGLDLLFVLYLWTFRVSHPFNNVSVPPYDVFLRNQLLALATINLATRSLFFLPIALAVFSLVTLPLQDRRSWTLYPFWVLAVLPVQLIEQRYSLAGVALVLLFRQTEGDRLEWAQLGWFVAWSMFFLAGISQARFFL